MSLEDTGDLSCVPRSRVLGRCQSYKSILHLVSRAFLAREDCFDNGWTLRSEDVQVSGTSSHFVTERALDAALEFAPAVFEEVRRSTLVQHFNTSDEILLLLSLAIWFEGAAGVEF